MHIHLKCIVSVYCSSLVDTYLAYCWPSVIRLIICLKLIKYICTRFIVKLRRTPSRQRNWTSNQVYSIQKWMIFCIGCKSVINQVSFHRLDVCMCVKLNRQYTEWSFRKERGTQNVLTWNFAYLSRTHNAWKAPDVEELFIIIFFLIGFKMSTILHCF